MKAIVLLLVGVVAGGGMNLAVQSTVARLQRRRSVRLAARVVYGELMEYGYVEINSSDARLFDASHVHAAWREHRAALADLGDREWSAIEQAVMAIVYPELEPPRPPDSHNATLDARWRCWSHTPPFHGTCAASPRWVTAAMLTGAL
jgi:hypothetical protein